MTGRIAFLSLFLLSSLMVVPSIQGQDSPPCVREPSRGVVLNVSEEAPTFGKLNVREKPNSEAKIVGNLKNGDEVVIEELAGSWYRISSPHAGFCVSGAIQVTGTRPSAKQSGPPLSVEEYCLSSGMSREALEKSVPPVPPPTVSAEAAKEFFRKMQELYRNGYPASPSP